MKNLGVYKNMNQISKKRWGYLILGAIVMLVVGIIYAWSILKVPLADEFQWGASQLALNFTITMTFFCLGSLSGSYLQKIIGAKRSLIIAAVVILLGFICSSRLDGHTIGALYVSYGILCGFGIGCTYNVLLANTTPWFPEKKGLCNGILMMGFGASALVLGKIADKMFFMPQFGWRKTYIFLGVLIFVIILIEMIIIKKPDDTYVVKVPQKQRKQTDFGLELAIKQIVIRSSFWKAFICFAFLSAVGSSVIAFVRDVSISVGASVSLAVMLVGVLSIFNGLGRIFFGVISDRAGAQKTLILVSIVTILATVMMLISVAFSVVPLCVLGLSLTGISYGACPTISSVFVMEYYGKQNYANNLSVMGFNLMVASFLATVSSMILTKTGGYLIPFVVLLLLTLIATVLNLINNRP